MAPFVSVQIPAKAIINVGNAQANCTLHKYGYFLGIPSHPVNKEKRLETAQREISPLNIPEFPVSAISLLIFLVSSFLLIFLVKNKKKT